MANRSALGDWPRPVLRGFLPAGTTTTFLLDQILRKAHPLLAEAINLAAVVGLPDARLAEVPVAFVRCEAGATVTEAEVIAHCRGRIASFKIPRHVIFVDEFPMTGSGKIQKVVLRERARTQLAGGQA